MRMRSYEIDGVYKKGRLFLGLIVDERAMHFKHSIIFLLLKKKNKLKGKKTTLKAFYCLILYY